MIPVLVADDHGFIRAGVEAVLRGTRFSVVATTASGEETLDAIKTHDPAVVLLDINMPGMNGVQALEALRERGDKRPVVLLTAEINDRQLISVMRAGVDGIVSKDGAEEGLVEVLEKVHAGQKAIEPNFLQRALDLSLRPDSQGPLAKLNPRERKIAALVARGMRNRDIGAELGIGEGTVKVYLHTMYQKLGIDNRTELALLAVNEQEG
ncbi:two component transcriptional regulator, LuxR family [Novosphingobium aromaticivorans DSM 12444]|uniref:Two component transcriptional regulator, LuxR family n=1 Tax=Novosphingobium aromaticivorans (strain ATCC 700278 / DSM 12444 / CCUG 56034 / CIP 105152 / NBRC 16084 / F199) TaxID=279238 RepID=Q2G8Z2_NOVAD|nr:response regulator transcription factor [Novosphingobium aromaticivorans]ABD25681.1 two component transcriptional regulator, LuxR family [Novosphingobium aromaticivorans DSM 12444]SCY00422.1 two component transcriptional regulator, LuxR family [Novosphingobium aromaticivorans]